MTPGLASGTAPIGDGAAASFSEARTAPVDDGLEGLEGVDYGPHDPDTLGPDGKVKIKLSPSTVALLGTGTVTEQTVKVSEAGYKGGFTEKSTCSKVATLSPTKLKKAGSVKITGKAAGSCTVTFSDTNKNKATLKISDTVVTFALNAAAISLGSKSATIVLSKPPKGLKGTTAIDTLPSCSNGCTVNGPSSPAGTRSWDVTIFDGAAGKGNALAGPGTVTFKVVAAKKNVVPVTLTKNVKTVSITSVPAAVAGTALAASAVGLAVLDADNNPITGTYAQAVSVASNDASGATVLAGGTGTGTLQSFANSSQKLTLAYTGLAIEPVTITGSATGAVTGTKGTFAPTLAAIVWVPGSGADVTPEIDLYATSGTGSSGAFSVTQAGWRGGSFNNNFTYATGGTSNNCSSYAIAPGSGTANAFTVTAQAGAAAGTCTMTVTGGAGQTLAVKLTYTTSSIGINGRHIH